MRCGFPGTHTVFIEFSTNFKQGRGQIVFSIVAVQQRKLSHWPLWTAEFWTITL